MFAEWMSNVRRRTYFCVIQTIEVVFEVKCNRVREPHKLTSFVEQHEFTFNGHIYGSTGTRALVEDPENQSFGGQQGGVWVARGWPRAQYVCLAR